MLFGEYGCGDEYSDLFAIFSSFESGADGEFCFAEADVATDEAVHGAILSHIVLDGLHGGELVFGFFVGEFCFELGEPCGGLRVAYAGHCFACGLDL